MLKIIQPSNTFCSGGISRCLRWGILKPFVETAFGHIHRIAGTVNTPFTRSEYLIQSRIKERPFSS
jgi:hypothetical protein